MGGYHHTHLRLLDAVADGLLPKVGVQRGHYQALAEDPVITVRTGVQNWLLQYNRGVQYRCTAQILQYVTSVQRCTVLFITVKNRFNECVITVQYRCTEVYRTCYLCTVLYTCTELYRCTELIISHLKAAMALSSHSCLVSA